MKGDITRSTFRREKHYTGVRMQQGRVQLDADWNEQLDIQAHLDQTTRNDLIGPCGAPEQDGGFRVGPSEDGKDLVISRGRIYVDGVLCENEEDVSISAQPDLLDFTLPTDTGNQGESNFYVTYLDVWHRDVSVLEDSEILEVALGGTDTATRIKTVWQVKLEKIDDTGDPPECGQFGPDWAPSGSGGASGLLRSQVEANSNGSDPCIIPPQFGYRGLENQLYRVEIHNGGVLGEAEGNGAVTPSFKWSRENGSVAARLEQTQGNVLTVSDSIIRTRGVFIAGQWIELTDDRRVLRGEAGVMVQLAAVDGNQLTVSEWPDGSPPELDENSAIIRRWDSDGQIPLSTEGFVDLEQGVEVEFHEGEYRAGDYWTIPARTAIGDVLWPTDEEGEALFEEPHGIHHRYCALALLELKDEQWAVLSDCRRIFRTVTEPIADDPGIHVTAVHAGADHLVKNDTDLRSEDLVQGLRVECDTNVDPDAIQQKPVCVVTLSLPYPFNQPDRALWGNEVIGHQPVVLSGQVRAENNFVVWTPEAATADWLENKLFPIMVDQQRGDRVLAYLTLKGNFIWGLDQSDLFLDGETFGIKRPGVSNVDMRLPSGNRKRGGDLDMWFWLVPGTAPAPQIGLQPASLNFGSVRIASTGTRTVRVSNSGNVSLNVTGLSVSNRQFRLSSTSAFNLTPGASRNLTVTFTPSRVGSQQADLTILNNDPTSRSTTVRLVGSGLAVPNINVTPTSINFGTVTIGRPARRSVTVRNSGSGRLSVSSVQAGSSFSASPRSFSLAPNTQRAVLVTFTPTQTRRITTQVLIRSNDPDTPNAVVQVSGVGRRPTTTAPPRPRPGPVGPPRPRRGPVVRRLQMAAASPNIQVEPTAIGFGDVGVGDRSVQTVNVRNTGSIELIVKGVSISSHLFSVSPTSFTLAAGEQQSLTVVFSPRAKGNRSASLTVTSNDPNNEVFSVKLEARGV